MRMSYDPSADAVYLSLSEISLSEMPHGTVHRSEEVAPATVLDYDQDGNLLLGIEVYAGAAGRVDPSPLVTRGFTFEEVRRRIGPDAQNQGAAPIPL